MNAHAKLDGRARLKCNPIVGSLPVLQYCAPEQLLIDETYQRSLECETSQALIRRIAASTGTGACASLCSSPGAAMAGCTSSTASTGSPRAVLRGDIAQLPCVVTHFDGAEQEAAAFVALNQQRRPLSALDLFKAALTSGDPAALRSRTRLDEAGLKLSNHASNKLMKPGHVCNIGGLQRCERMIRQQVLTLALKVLAQAYPQQVLRYAGSIFPGIAAVVGGELHNRAAPDDLVARFAGFVGREPQLAWYKRFTQAKVDDPNLKHSSAAEKVLRSAWVEWSQAQLGLPKKDSVPAPVVPAGTDLRPAEMAWCEQCELRRSGAQAAACTSPWCKLKLFSVADVPLARTDELLAALQGPAMRAVMEMRVEQIVRHGHTADNDAMLPIGWLPRDAQDTVQAARDLMIAGPERRDLGTARRRLVKAAAILLAAIDRLDGAIAAEPKAKEGRRA
jgi:hypothetical protein